MKTRLLIPFLLLALAACNHSSNSEVASQRYVPYPPSADLELKTADPGEKSMKGDANTVADNYSSEGDNAVQDTTKKITREGEIKFKTADIAKTRTSVLAALKAASGYLAEEKEFIDEDDSTKNYTLDVRIPAKGFDKFLNRATETAAQIDSKDITTTDVTPRYIDITTRLRNKKALETRYLELLHQSARMADILEVENKLNEIRTEIETTQGQLNYLNKQIAYSSLQITFYTKRTDLPVIGQTGNRLLDSLKNGWLLLQHLFFGLISLWPVLLVGYVAVFLFRRWRKRKKLKNQN